MGEGRHLSDSGERRAMVASGSMRVGSHGSAAHAHDPFGAVDADSSGRSSARYASARPRTIPPAYAGGNTEHAMPAVVVDASVEQTSLAPGQANLEADALRHSRTIRMGRSPAPPAGSPFHLPTPAAAFVPPMQKRTVHMGARPRVPTTPTLIVRRDFGPSVFAQVAVFSVMLALVTAVGLGVVAWQRPSWFQRPVPAPAVAVWTPSLDTPQMPSAAATSVTAPLTSSAAVALPSPLPSSSQRSGTSVTSSPPAKKGRASVTASGH